MVAALETRNDYGTVQLDGSSLNMMFVKKGLAYPNNVLNPVYVSSPVSHVLRYPVVAIRTLTATNVRVNIEGAGTTTLSMAFIGAPGTVEWFLFDAFAVDAAPTTGGLQLFSETGELVYSSNRKALAAFGIAKVPDGWPGSGGPVAKPAGPAAWAVVVGSTRLSLNYVAGYTRYTVDGIGTHTGAVTLAPVYPAILTAGNHAGSTPAQPTGGHLTFIDVTGL